MKEKNWPITTEISLQWGDMDAFNHVNNVIYIRWCETSRIELFRKIWLNKGLQMQEILEGDGVGPILANFNINYRLPLVYPDIVYIDTRISYVGNSSFKVEHSLKSKNNGNEIIADADSVIVLFNYKNGTKFKITEEHKKKLETYMG